MPSTPTDPWLWPTSPVPLQRPALPVTVSRYTPPAGGEGADAVFTLLDNIECTAIQQDMGIDPGRATIRYRFTDLDDQAPQSIEQALSLAVNLPKTVQVDDQIVIQATRPDGQVEYLFWGKPARFGLQIDPITEEVTIDLVGIAKQAWETPVDGLLIRDSSNLATGKDVQTDIPAQFNPKGKANATAAGYEVNAAAMPATDNKYPTFEDPDIADDPNHPRRSWTLAMAARYLIYRYVDLNPDTPIDVPTGDVLDSTLVSREPISGTAFDPTNAATYTVKQITASDRPLTGRDWPGLLNDMIRDKGFGMSWDLNSDDSSNPTTTLSISLLQDGPLKDIYLQTRGSYIDPEQSNIGQADISRDINQVVNQWEVKGALNRYEVSLILWPGFPMNADDGSSMATLATFDRTNPACDMNAYRLFVYDEAGEAHWPNFAALGEEVNGKPGNLDPILGMPDSNGNAAYARRRRKAIGQLIETDADGEPLRYSLAISKDYSGLPGQPWNRSGTWQTVSGGFELLDDRIGIRLTATNPNGWKIGKSELANAPYPGGVVPVVDSLCQKDANNPSFVLRLTIVIQGDKAVTGIAAPTPSSVTTETITRQVDARDRYAKWTQCQCSEHFDADTYDADQVVRDDGDAAKAEAIACRVATEAGILNGQVVIPRLTRYYQLGDRIRQINGRDLGLRTDNGGDANTNAPIYPVVVGISHTLAGRQATFLTLSDQDGHRYRIEGKTRRH